MYIKFLCLFSVVLAADGAIISGKCQRVTNPVEPDLHKLSGLWHVVAAYPNDDNSGMVDLKKDGANYTATYTNTLTTSSHTESVAVGVDEENRKVVETVHNGEPPHGSYLLAAEYDNFFIIYTCFTDNFDRVSLETVSILSRSKDVNEDTRKKIKSVLLEYPQLKEIKDKFD